MFNLNNFFFLISLIILYTINFSLITLLFHFIFDEKSEVLLFNNLDKRYFKILLFLLFSTITGLPPTFIFYLKLYLFMFSFKFSSLIFSSFLLVYNVLVYYLSFMNFKNIKSTKFIKKNIELLHMINYFNFIIIFFLSNVFSIFIFFNFF